MFREHIFGRTLLMVYIIYYVASNDYLDIQPPQSPTKASTQITSNKPT